MHLRHGILICKGLILVAAVLLWSTQHAGAVRGARTADPWSAFRNRSATSPMWSPKGGHIAFVSIGNSDYEDEDGFMPLRASIWVGSPSEQGRIVSLRRLALLERGEGIPVALFWLDDNQIGWASSRTSSFTFSKMGLGGGKRQRITARIFRGVQNRVDMGGPAFCGPDDVYWDTASSSLLFSGGMTPTGVYVQILPISAGKARRLSVPGADEAAPVSLCGSLGNPKRPEFYVAAGIGTRTGGQWRLWLSHSYSLKPDKILATSPERFLLFPRTSPDGRTLAYLSYETKTSTSNLVLQDLASGDHRTLTTIPYGWEGLTPAMGCPFSWSPDGKKIAYADGSRIKIIPVPSAISGGGK